MIVFNIFFFTNSIYIYLYFYFFLALSLIVIFVFFIHLELNPVKSYNAKNYKSKLFINQTFSCFQHNRYHLIVGNFEKDGYCLMFMYKLVEKIKLY